MAGYESFLETGSDCPVHDWLGSHRIPHISEQNSAEEAVCKLPAYIKHMAVYNVRKAYGFTQMDYDAELIPEYVHAQRLTDDTIHTDANATCAELVDSQMSSFTWVNWIPPIKRQQADRIWIVENLNCLTEDVESVQIHRPGVPAQTFMQLLPFPMTSFHVERKKLTSTYDASRDAFNEYKRRYDDFVDRLEDWLKDFNKYLKSRSHYQQKLQAGCGITISSSSEKADGPTYGEGEDATTLYSDKIVYTFKPNVKELISIEDGKTKLWNDKLLPGPVDPSAIDEVLKMDTDESDCKVKLMPNKDGIVICCDGNMKVIPFKKGLLFIPKPKENKDEDGNFEGYDWDSYDPCPTMETVEDC